MKRRKKIGEYWRGEERVREQKGMRWRRMREMSREKERKRTRSRRRKQTLFKKKITRIEKNEI